MDIKECYEQMQGDYESAMSRLMKEERIKKYLAKFARSCEYDALCEAMAAQNWDGVFRATHTMKGVALNMGINKLGESASELCEMVRNGAPTGDVDAAFEVVKEDYARTVAAIDALGL